MHCPACQHANGPQARFCANCGTSLARTCPTCAAGVEPDAKFCSNCGTNLGASEPAVADTAASDELSRYVPEELLRKIRAARSGQTMRGERRTVTMLFADIQGSTAAAEHLDPEEWAEIMNGAFGHLIQPVYRYEGTLARLQGDAILAFFGAPIAHEDDPARAVRAGLDIITAIEPYRAEVTQRFGVEIAVRVGINTGLVVVGEVGSDLRVEYTALGDAINVAARMEQTAQPGSVQVTEDTLRLLADAFETATIGPVEVKGKAEPVVSHRVLRHLGARAPAPAPTKPMIGRDTERVQLTRLLGRLREGFGSVCTIVGEAGMGKSRLVAQLRSDAETELTISTNAAGDADVSWLRGRAESYEHNTPHATFIDLLSDWWADASTPDCHGVVMAAVERADPDAGQDTATLLANLIGATLPVEQNRYVTALAAPILHGQTTEAVARHLAAEARRRPLIMVLDDLHWADAMSLTLAERLIEVAALAPILLVLVMRPRRDEPSWRLTEVAARHHPDHQIAIDLDALPGEASDQLLKELLGSTTVDTAVRADILTRSQGNPLFLEEIVRSLADGAGVAGTERSSRPAGIEVPPSLTGLLASRLDRLEEPSRHLAQVASVIGRDFDLGALVAVAGDEDDLHARVTELVRRGILEERRRLPEPAYAFRHPLIRETAYSTVLLRTRRELHGRIARYLEPRDPDAVQEIANHYLQAGEARAAFPFLLEAGKRAVRAMALRDAVQFFTAALEAPPEDVDPARMMEAHDGLGQAYSMVPDLSHASATYQSLLDYGKSSSAPRVQVMALNRLGFGSAALAGDFDTADAYLTQARDLATDIGDDDGLAEYHMNACFVSSMRGDMEAAVHHDGQTVRIGKQAGNELVRLTGLTRMSMNLIATSRFDEAQEAYAEALQAAEQSGDEEAVAILQAWCEPVFALRRGNVRGAIEGLRQPLAMIDRYTSFYGAGAHQRMADCAMLAGEVELALSEYAAAGRFGAALGQPFADAIAAAGRTRALSVCGLVDELDGLREQAIAILEMPGGDFLGTTVWADLGTASLESGDLDAARSDLETALTTQAVSSQWERPRVRHGLARVALLAGDLATAIDHIAAARQLVTTGGLRYHEAELLLLDGAVAAAQGREADATSLLGEAVTAATESGQRLLRIEALGRLAAQRGAAGEPAEATALRDRAQATIREAAGLIVDEDLRQAFLDRRTAALTAAPAG